MYDDERVTQLREHSAKRLSLQNSVESDYYGTVIVR
jgi:hypothetical protein